MTIVQSQHLLSVPAIAHPLPWVLAADIQQGIHGGSGGKAGRAAGG